MKKNRGNNFAKITDFFNEGQNTQLIEDINKTNSNKIGNKNITDKKNGNLNQDGKYLGLQEEDDSNQKLKEPKMIENKYKRKKMEEINNINNNISKNNINHIGYTPSFFIGLNSQSPIDKERKLILLDLTNDKTLLLKELNLTPNNFSDPSDYNSSFPFQNCRIININNIAYITGGKLNDDISKLNYYNKFGEKKCFKLIASKEESDIKIEKIPSSIFEHQSHSLLYSKQFNTLLLCSGHKQINCEYLNLNEKELNWKRIYPLTKPRENALAFLFNEKYIFLIGGKNEEGIINEDYDVIDFEIFISNKVQNYWKTYSFKNKEILERICCGTINIKNDVYILGGFNKKNEFCSWKINFEQDEDDDTGIFIKEKFDKLYKINSVITCDKINNYFKKQKYNNYICYCGQQNFLSFNGFLFNISLGGLLTIVPESLL